MKPYPTLSDSSNASLKTVVDFITRERTKDITDFNGLPNTYIAGRKVAKIPTSSSDIAGSFPGDFNVTASFAYFCINNAGTTQWVRVAVGTF